MIDINIRTVNFRGQEVTVYEDQRLRDDRLPHLYYYEMRHPDNDLSIPATVERFVLVNFWGTLISTEPLDFQKDPASGLDEYIDLSEEESELFAGVEQ